MSKEIETGANHPRHLDLGPVLVLGGTGKTGRRVTEKLARAGHPVRIGSRRGAPAFDWADEGTWRDALAGAGAVYLSYYPDLAAPGALAATKRLTELALEAGARRIVLLSGRGEPEAEAAEAMLKASGADWTIVRAAWFAQNFSESFLLDAVRDGTVALPVDPEIREPFIDADDIAEVAVAALTDDRHVGRLYEVTGPRLLTLPEAVAEIAAATGRPLHYQRIPAEAYAEGMAEAGVPEEMASLVLYLFSTIMDGRNATRADGVAQALGRPARDFADYARATAATGLWRDRAA